MPNKDVRLKKLLLVIIIVLGTWKYYPREVTIVEPYVPAEQPAPQTDLQQIPIKIKTSTKSISLYRCDGRQHCSQMNSYGEAKYFIDHCPDTKMDGDNDGIPCERQFRR